MSAAASLDAQRAAPYRSRTAMAFLLNWIISALSLLVVGRLVPGFQVDGFGTALLAAAVLGFINATLGTVLMLLTLPLTIEIGRAHV